MCATSTKAKLMLCLALVVMLPAASSLAADVTSQQPVASQKTVAVLPTRLQGPIEKLGAVGDGLGDVLAIVLAEDSCITVVERAKLNRIADEEKLKLTAVSEPDEISDVGRLIDARFIVTSSIKAADDNIEVRCMLMEVEGARIVHTAKETGKLDKLYDIIHTCATGVAHGLNADISKLKQEDFDRSPRIGLLFMRGLSFFHEGLFNRAQVEFLKVNALSPMHEDARAYSAKAFHEAGAFEHARLAAEWFLANFPESSYRKELEAMIPSAPEPEESC